MPALNFMTSQVNQISTDIRNSFTGMLGKFAIKIPPHPKRVATLPCEILYLKLTLIFYKEVLESSASRH